MRKLIELVSLAQIASTAGKYRVESGLHEKLYSLRQEAVERAEMLRYAAKDDYIREALKYCANNKVQGVHWTVMPCTDGKPLYIVYFRFAVNGTSYQVSFHSFDTWLKPWVNCGGNTRWVGRAHNGKTKIRGTFVDSSEALNIMLTLVPELRE